jgi:hypothetical protein
MTDKNMGWQCPKCLVVYAPSVEKCQCSVISKVSYSGFGTTGTAYICTLFLCNTTDGICSKCGQPEWKHNNISYT